MIDATIEVRILPTICRIPDCELVLTGAGAVYCRREADCMFTFVAIIGNTHYTKTAYDYSGGPVDATTIRLATEFAAAVQAMHGRGGGE